MRETSNHFVQNQLQHSSGYSYNAGI